MHLFLLVNQKDAVVVHVTKNTCIAETSRALGGGGGKAHKMSGIEGEGEGERIGVNYVTGMGRTGFNTGSDIGR